MIIAADRWLDSGLAMVIIAAGVLATPQQQALQANYN